MKRLPLVIVFLAFATFAASGRTDFYKDVRKLPSARRTEVTIRAVLPMYFGASTQVYIPGAPALRDPGFTYSFEMLGLRFTSKSGPLEANVAVGWEFLQHASYFNAPLRLAVKPGGSWKLFAGAAPAVLLGNPAPAAAPEGAAFNRFRLSAQAGVAYRSIGLFASYGLTPLYLGANGVRTLSFGLVVGI
ncbi:MAG: hypothetical protein J6S62_01480 [Bacteroidales bacterium]|nr:hypothetical protein [Bacteroidales bacterium]